MNTYIDMTYSSYIQDRKIKTNIEKNK